MPTRRRFFELSAAAAGALGLSPLIKLPLIAEPFEPDGLSGRRDVGRARVPLNILILGGTGFTGPEQVEYAIARGHRVTLFNRNQTRPGFFKGRVAEELIGDLGADTSALQGKKFDVVIDNPTTFPAWVRNAAKYLAGNTNHYIFISTTSTYRDQSQIGIDENSPTTPMPADLDPYTLDPANAGRYYGALKTRAEQEVATQYPGINTVIRPCLIVGPLDRTDRFTYWPARIDKGGEVLDPRRRSARARHVQRHRPGKAVDDWGDAQRHKDSDQLECDVHLGAVGIPERTRCASLAAHDRLAAAGRRNRGISTTECGQGDREGFDVPSTRRDGEGHACLAQDASGKRATRNVKRRDQRPPDEEGGRSSRRVEGQEGQPLANLRTDS
jgi:hypothetical protein